MLILKVVAPGPIHGYGISQRLKHMSSNVLDVRQGSLYPALHRMEKEGLVSAKWLDSDAGHQAKFYSITRAGRKRLDHETVNWETLSNAIAFVLRTAD